MRSLTAKWFMAGIRLQRSSLMETYAKANIELLSRVAHHKDPFGMGTIELWKLPSEYHASQWYEAYMGYAGMKTDPFQKL